MGGMLRVRVLGAPEVVGKFRKLGASMRGALLKEAVIAGGKIIEAEAKRLAPVRTGNLSRSITTQIVSATLTSATASVGTNLIYAQVQEYGATIHAKRARYLVFPLDDGTWRRAKSVTIPPRPYLRPAFDHMGGAAVAAIAAIVRSAVAAA